MKTKTLTNRILIVFMTLFGLIGYINNVKGQCTLCGFGSASGTGAVSAGGDVTGDDSGAFGATSTVYGEESFAIGTATVGTSTTDADGSYAIGVKAFAYGDNSISIGHKVETASSSSHSYAFGRGITGTNLINDISSSIMLGMNSDEPTLFVEGAAGTSGSLGRVGIGTTDPDAMLHLIDESNVNTTLIIESGGSNSRYLQFQEAGDNSAYIRQYSSDLLEIRNEETNADINMNVSIGGTQTSVLNIDGATGFVGVNTTSPGEHLDVRADATTPEEQIAKFRVSDASGNQYLMIANRSTDANEFSPWIEGVATADDHPALELTARTFDTQSGTTPVMVFDSRVGTGSAAPDRPLFRWKSSATTSLMEMDDQGNLGIGTTTPDQLLDVNGNIRISGVPAGSGTEDVLGIDANDDLVNVTQSSIHFKENIQELEFDKSAFLSMEPVRFNWKEFYGGNPDVGFVAQQVEDAFPEMGIYRLKRFYEANGDFVRDSTGAPVIDSTQTEVRGVRYHKLAVYLYSIVKQQDQLLDMLEQRVTDLEILLGNCCESGQSFRMAEIDDTIQESYVLSQNDPNPFADFTTVTVAVPSSSKGAQLLISNAVGSVLKVIDLKPGLEQRITLYSSELGKGTFSYTLLLDGRPVETKRMVSMK